MHTAGIPGSVLRDQCSMACMPNVPAVHVIAEASPLPMVPPSASAKPPAALLGEDAAEEHSPEPVGVLCCGMSRIEALRDCSAAPA